MNLAVEMASGRGYDQRPMGAFTLLIAGPANESTPEFLGRSELPAVISTWEGGIMQYPRGAVVYSRPPNLEGLHNSQNIYLQTLTVCAGLELVRTDGVVKARSDEYYSGLDGMLERFSGKLLTANVFVRDVHYAKYSMSDHLMIASTDKLKGAYQGLKAYIEDGADPYGILNDRTPAEVKIGLFYLRSCGYDIGELIAHGPDLALEIMKKEFDVFDVEELKPYKIRSSVAGDIYCLRRFVNRDRKLDLRYISSMEQFAGMGRLANLVFKIGRRVRGMVTPLPISR